MASAKQADGSLRNLSVPLYSLEAAAKSMRSAPSIQSANFALSLHRADHACFPHQVDINKVYVTLSSIILAFAFVFGNNIRNLYENVIFLFVVHPYDVGDVLLVEGVWHQASVSHLMKQCAVAGVVESTLLQTDCFPGSQRDERPPKMD